MQTCDRNWWKRSMRLLEAIIDANHRAAAGDDMAGLHPSDFADSLPLVALTCIDPRLNPLMPEVLGIPEDKFIWLRNAGNIITGPISSMMRSLALACAIKGGREIAVIGHTDCLVCKTSRMELTERLKALGLERGRLPENLTEFFGLFASERQNVIKAVEFVRASPIIGPAIPVHGLLVNIESGRLEWLVNGYQALESRAFQPGLPGPQPSAALGAFKDLLPFDLGQMPFPEAKIGELAARAGSVVSEIGRVAGQAEHLAGKAGEFAEKVGQIASGAGRWLSEVHVHGPAGKTGAAKPPPNKPIPVPPPIRVVSPPPKGGKGRG